MNYLVIYHLEKYKGQLVTHMAIHISFFFTAQQIYMSHEVADRYDPIPIPALLSDINWTLFSLCLPSSFFLSISLLMSPIWKKK